MRRILFGPALFMLWQLAVPAGVTAQPFSVVATDFPGADIGAKINAASAAYPQGVEIRVPGGRYPFSTTIRLKRSDVLMGVSAGEGGEGDGTCLEYTGSGTAIDLAGSTSYRPVVFLENFRLENRRQGKYGIYAVYPTRYFSIRNIVIDGFETGMYINSAWINNFMGVRVYNSTNAGIDINVAYTVQFYNCMLYGGNPGMRINYGNLVSLIGCTFHNQSGVYGLLIDGGGTGNSVMNCYFEDSGTNASVYISGDQSVSVQGCTFLSNSRAQSTFIQIANGVKYPTVFHNSFTKQDFEFPAIRLACDVVNPAIGSNYVSGGEYISNPCNLTVSPIGRLSLDSVPSPGFGTLAGHIELQGYFGVAPVAVSVELIRGGLGNRTEVFIMNGSGEYTISNLSSGTYDVAFDAWPWLRQVVRGVVIPSGGTGTAGASLPNGDTDRDNVVTTTDLSTVLLNLGRMGDR